jgi:hypothetical protein
MLSSNETSKALKCIRQGHPTYFLGPGDRMSLGNLPIWMTPQRPILTVFDEMGGPQRTFLGR